MKYTSFTEEDFVMDEYFQKWILDDDPVVRNFWEGWLRENPDKRNLVEGAADFVRTIHSSGYEKLSEEQVGFIFDSIIAKRDGFKADNVDNRSFIHNKGRYKFWAAAACVGLLVGALTLNLFWGPTNSNDLSTNIGNEVRLKLDDGTVRILSGDSSKTIMDSKGRKMGRQNRNSLSYETKSAKISKIRYNELVVPNGKKFELSLSDGSHVFLNSGSKLRYPVAFAQTKSRTVFLDGEAFFSIEKDSVRPFVVVTEDMNTRVYGTKFNVSSYKNEKNTYTVLVEGSVGVYKPVNGRPETLKNIVPGERAVMHDGEVSIDRVNTEKYVAWTEGKLFFANDRFDLILKKLERHFNVVIRNNIEELNNKRFTGTFTDESLDRIFRIFQEHTPFNYTLKEDTITINGKV